jgi:hypothetical protein
MEAIDISERYKVVTGCSKGKMLDTERLFLLTGIMYHEFIPENAMVKKVILACLPEAIRWKSPKVLAVKGCVLLYDNGPQYFYSRHSLSMGSAVLTHPPYPPYLTRSDFYLFLWMKDMLKKGRHFKDTAHAEVAS